MEIPVLKKILHMQKCLDVNQQDVDKNVPEREKYQPETEDISDGKV